MPSVKDLGIHFQPNLKFTIHIKDIISKAKRRSALIFRCFLSRSTPNLLRAYKTYVRPLAEYASTVWSPSTVMLINDLESIQKHFTKRLPGLKFKTYADRLKVTGLQSLEYWRLVADLILCFKIVRGYSGIKFDDMFNYSKNTTSRGHPLRLSIPLSKTNLSKFSFAHRIIPPWNSLPTATVLAPSVNSFKIKLSNHDFYFLNSLFFNLQHRDINANFVFKWLSLIVWMFVF